MNFIQQAYKGRNDWYHYFATILGVFVGWQIIGILPLVITAVTYSKNTADFMGAAASNFMNLGIDKNLYLVLMLLTLVGGLMALLIGVNFIHKRPIKTVITSRKTIDWKRFWVAFTLWGTVAFLITFTGIYLSPDTYTWNFRPVPFFTLLAISLVLLPLQTSFEELLFRGYLMQGFGTWFRNRWLPLILTSVIFGLLHSANPEVEKLGYISMVFYIGTGLFYGIVTLMDEGTELALGLHAINNIVAAVFVTTDWAALQTDALFIDTAEPSASFEMFFPVLIIYPLMLLFFAKTYKWRNWKQKLTGSITNPIQGDVNDDISSI